MAAKSSCDTHGRLWLTKREAKPGTIIEVDDGFNCITKGRKTTLYEDHDGLLYFQCEDGKHFIEPNACYGRFYLGIYCVAVQDGEDQKKKSFTHATQRVQEAKEA